MGTYDAHRSADRDYATETRRIAHGSRTMLLWFVGFTVSVDALIFALIRSAAG